MNLYTQNRNWKVFLLIFATIIVAVSLWYTNGFINKVSRSEKDQVELWAKAISKKAHIVNYTEKLFSDLREKEKRYVYLWAQATRKLITAGPNDDIEFLTGVISGNKDIPMIVTNEEGYITASKNLSLKHQQILNLNSKNAHIFTDYPPIKALYFENQYNYIYFRNSNTYYQLKRTLNDLIRSFVDEIANNGLSTPVIITDSTKLNIISYGGDIDTNKINNPIDLASYIDKMASEKDPIIVTLTKGKYYVFYDESETLTRLRYFPFILFIAILIFLITAYTLFNISRKSEQSKVWAGMAKETAHQLGTPISSLMGWNELMKLNYPSEEGFMEMDKDIDRLKLVSERFSKIGSIPELKPSNVIELIEGVTNYMQSRVPSRIKLSINNKLTDNCLLNLNNHLIIWVFENLIRNAVDAIGANEGSITITISETDKGIGVDIADSGKGIPKSNQKTIFNPGFSTKSRGWGLGLSLSKRIIEEYHKGRIYVKSSAINEGSIFRISLRK
ncbi:MAG: HAMP domain-containing histidine kinase [Bacteroidales bacterium]|nr:HAMP domain-containing histidine kinase [Bacteroidales bacterium]